MLNNFLERLSGPRLYARLHDVLMDTGVLQTLKVADADWSNIPSAPQVSILHATPNNVYTLLQLYGRPIRAVGYRF